MAETQTVIPNPDPIEKGIDTVDFLALQKTPEKKVRSVGFYELDVLRNTSEDTETTNLVKCEVTEDDDKGGEDADKGGEDAAQDGQPQEHNDPPPNYFDQTLPSSPKRCRKQSNPTCLCKECVENYMNMCENGAEPAPDDKDEVTSVDEKSLRSRSGSETSRRTNSSEDDFVGTKYEDAQVTLPYPNDKRAPESITRLSNAGLYDPSDDHKGKEEEDNASQVVIRAAFFVEHPPFEDQKKNVHMDTCDNMDVEKGDPESQPLIRLTRRSVEREPEYPELCMCHLPCLKIVGSFILSMVMFPALLYAAYAWLPFDAPLIPDVPSRLVYTLRCSTFASFPIILGVMIHGISRLCTSSYDPFKPQEREVTIHRRFVKQGTFLFVLFFFNLSVLATYLPQQQLKFIPLLTCLFALSQLIYWLSFAVGRSFRGFGYGLTFLPLLSMMICNLYFMFVVEPEKMVFLGSRVVPQH
ncbi:transmembrane protein 79 [Anomaloglossus baeobatrachus]|uniref:transmembrane protein 79 n=1 Tax=Anomaloglossus baeobatrachus TaxID=238106 RepID=UPI003F508064